MVAPTRGRLRKLSKGVEGSIPSEHTISIPVLPLRRWEPSYGYDVKLPYSALDMALKCLSYLPSGAVANCR